MRFLTIRHKHVYEKSITVNHSRGPANLQKEIMGRDLCYRIIYDEKDLERKAEDHEWIQVDNVSRHNEVLGYIDKRFTKQELQTFMKKLLKETMEYDYNMSELADALKGLSQIADRLNREEWIVEIRYD
jgi:predicted house-cleaning noncanonical NTP pyrophosphatase (MazG superfamily)